MSREYEADVPGGATLPGTLPDALRAELIAFRRDMHMHPELGNHEFRTTAALKARLERAGLEPRVLDIGTGLICDIGIDGAEGAGKGERGEERDRVRAGRTGRRGGRRTRHARPACGHRRTAHPGHEE